MTSEFSLQKQFLGFLNTSEIVAENAFFDTSVSETTCESLAEETLLKLEEPETFVLGKRMEYFFKFYIENFSAFEILLHNRQVIVDKKTRGELDFILKDRRSHEILHVELVYKFYLYDPDTGTSEIDHFIGPNRRDNLHKKLQRLQKHQFPLLFDRETAAMLPKEIDLSAVVQKMCFKANLFLPKQTPAPTFSVINEDAVSGCWIKAADFNSETYAAHLFYSPKKPFWPIPPHFNTTWYSFDEISTFIQPLLEKEFSPLLWVKSKTGTFERLFVVWW